LAKQTYGSLGRDVLNSAKDIHMQIGSIMQILEDYLKDKYKFISPNTAAVTWDGSNAYYSPASWSPRYFARIFTENGIQKTKKCLFYYIPLERKQGPLFVIGVFHLKKEVRDIKNEWRTIWFEQVAESVEEKRLMDGLEKPYKYDGFPSDHPVEAIDCHTMLLASVDSEKKVRTLVDKMTKLYNSR